MIRCFTEFHCLVVTWLYLYFYKAFQCLGFNDTLIDIFRYCKLLIQEMAVKVDQGFLNAIISLFSSGAADEAQQLVAFKQECALVNSSLTMSTSSTSASNIKHFYDILHFSPLKVCNMSQWLWKLDGRPCSWAQPANSICPCLRLLLIIYIMLCELICCLMLAVCEWQCVRQNTTLSANCFICLKRSSFTLNT